MHSLRNTAIAAVLFAAPLYAGAAATTLASISPSSAEQRSVPDDAAIRPYHIAIPQAALDDLRKRVRATRWPDKETVTDQSQGVQLARIQALVQYWGSDYDWRKIETKLNSLNKGGHFAAWEQPELFAAELRAAFKPLR